MDNITNVEIEDILNKIVKTEEDKYGIKIDFLSTTPQKYIIGIIKNCDNKFLSIIPLLTKPFFCKGYSFKNSNNIVVFTGSNIDIFSNIHTTYHEIRHLIQDTFEEYSYERFLYDVDYYLMKKYNTKYNTDPVFHDTMSYEIGANLYGIRETEKFLKDNYPEIYKQNIDRINYLKERVEYYYFTYNIHDHLSQLLELLDNGATVDDKNLLNILNIFLDENNHFKSMKEIMNNDKFKLLDKRIIYAFLCTKKSIEIYDNADLSKEEIYYIKEALKYTETVCNNQMKCTENHKEKYLKVKNQKTIKL